ncbi:MAG: DUF6941 family protein [Archangium sp.]
MNRSLLIVCVLVSFVAGAAEPAPKLKGSKKEQAPKLDLGVPTFTEIPKDQKLETATPKDNKQTSPTSTRVDESYSLVRVVHGKTFTRGPDGAKAATPYTQVVATSNPNTTERFSSVIRVKSPAKKNTRIEVVVLDQRGDTVMDAQGELRFASSEETEWQVDWEPTGFRAPGDWQVLVRVGGTPLGTTPLKVVASQN